MGARAGVPGAPFGSMDLYSILGVDPSADAESIKSAYRTLARRHHPDAGGDATRMAQINDAWAILGDAILRRRYDRENGHTRLGRAVMAPAPPASNPGPPPAAAQASWSAPTPPAPSAARTGRVLDFGRYAGWSILELSRSDPDYLLWLERTPIGRSFRNDIASALQSRQVAAAAFAGAGPAFRQAGGSSGGLLGRLFR
jgi:curved DNA-binding protein CbpA